MERSAARALFWLSSLLWVVFPARMTAHQLAGQPKVSDWRTFHRRNDEYWARLLTATTGWRDAERHDKIRVSANDVRDIRLLAGISDDDPSDPIIDLIGMRPDEYLLVQAGAAQCLNLAVYRAGFRGFRQVWSADSLPNGERLCQQPGCRRPLVQVSEKHEIYVSLFSRSTSDQPTCDQAVLPIYARQGNSFAFVGDERKPLSCWLGDYTGAVEAALRRAAGQGDILVTVQDWPALSSKSAVVFQQESTGIRVLRMEFDSLPLDYKKSAAECYSQAASIPVRVKEKHVAQERARKLLDELHAIRFRSDRCARAPDTSCAQLADGRGFELQVGDDSPISLTDVSGLTGSVSENPALESWVLRVLHEFR